MWSRSNTRQNFSAIQYLTRYLYFRYFDQYAWLSVTTALRLCCSSCQRVGRQTRMRRTETTARWIAVIRVAPRPGLSCRMSGSECRGCLPIWWAISIARSPECVSWWSIHFRSVIMCIRLLIWKTLNSSIFRSPFSNSPHWEEPWGTPKNHT